MSGFWSLLHCAPAVVPLGGSGKRQCSVRWWHIPFAVCSPCGCSAIAGWIVVPKMQDWLPKFRRISLVQLIDLLVILNFGARIFFECQMIPWKGRLYRMIIDIIFLFFSLRFSNMISRSRRDIATDDDWCMYIIFCQVWYIMPQPYDCTLKSGPA